MLRLVDMRLQLACTGSNSMSLNTAHQHDTSTLHPSVTPNYIAGIFGLAAGTAIQACLMDSRLICQMLLLCTMQLLAGWKTAGFGLLSSATLCCTAVDNYTRATTLTFTQDIWQWL